MVDKKKYQVQEPAWCPGCGNFALLNALRKTLADLSLAPHQITIVSGIGQAAKLPHYLPCNTFNGLHGRALPVATGIAMVNTEMKVLVTTGDGDCYGEGGNHFIHAVRRNINIKLFVHNNQIYGLTKGQASPTSSEGMQTKTQPFGSLSTQLNPLALAIALDCSFVARGFVGDIPFLQHLMTEAVRHKGFALIDILQPCISFNKVNTFSWFRERIYKLDDSYSPEDKNLAFQASQEWGKRIPTGIFYRKTYPLITDKIPFLQGRALLKQPVNKVKAKAVLEEFY